MGREWVSAAVFLRDPAASTGNSVMVRLVDMAFEAPVTVPPQVAEEFEEVTDKKAKGAEKGTTKRRAKVM